MTDVIAADRLASFVRRIERLQEMVDAAAADQKTVYAEAKGEGFDTKILRKVIARRRKGEEAIKLEDELIQLYEGAIQGELPLEDAA